MLPFLSQGAAPGLRLIPDPSPDLAYIYSSDRLAYAHAYGNILLLNIVPLYSTSSHRASSRFFNQHGQQPSSNTLVHHRKHLHHDLLHPILPLQLLPCLRDSLCSSLPNIVNVEVRASAHVAPSVFSRLHTDLLAVHERFAL